MGFEKIGQWVRHQSTLDESGASVCARCGISLPRLLPVSQVMLTKEDRILIGDDPRAPDCHV